MGDIRNPNYLVFDGRANYDLDAACVMGVYYCESEEEAVKIFKADWTGHDAVLFKLSDKALEQMYLD